MAKRVVPRNGKPKLVLAKRGDAPGKSAPVKVVKRKSVAKTAFSHGIRLADGKRSASSVAASQSDPTTTSPYPGFQRPSPAEVIKLHSVLAQHFGERLAPRKRKPRRQILDTVVGTILSQNTTNINSHRAFQQLMDKFRNWDAVRKAKPAAVAGAIKCGGLAPKKTKWIQHILKTVQKERGETSMEYLRKESKQDVHTQLERFTGIGKKTSAIINLFDVGHPDMAVDTHVFRYAAQLGWAPTDKEIAKHNKVASRDARWPVVTRDTVYEHLDATFPDHLKYSMHLILTDTVGGLPVVCGARNTLSFDGKRISIDGIPLKGNL